MLAWPLVLLFLFLLAGTSLTDLLYPQPLPTKGVDGEVCGRLLAQPASLRDGSLATRVENLLRFRSRVRAEVSKHYATWLYLGLGEVSNTLIAGEDHWLFTRQRAIPPEGDPARRARAAAVLLKAVQGRLADVGLDFLVLPIPRKAVIYADLLPPGVDPQPEFDRGLYRELEELEVPFVDLFEVAAGISDEPSYYPTDSHWNQVFGARSMEATAKKLGALAPLEERITEMHHYPVPTNYERFDLFTFGGMQMSHAEIDPFRQQGVNCYDVRMGEGPMYAFPARLAAGRSPAAIVLSGTSFLDSPDVPRFLSHYTQQAVMNAAVAGSKLLEPLRLLLTQQERFPGIETIVLDVPLHQLFLEQDADGRMQLPPEVGAFFRDVAPGVFGQHEATAQLELGPGIHAMLPMEIGRQERLLLRLPGGVLSTSGLGEFQLRVRGELSGAAAELRLVSKGLVLAMGWEPGMRAVNLPLLDLEPGDQAFELYIRSREGCELKIEGVEAVQRAQR